MMEAAPAAAFEVAQAEFLFQFFVVAFNDPALFRQSDQVAQSDLFRQVRQPVFARFGFAAWPLDQQPLLLSRWISSGHPQVRSPPHLGARHWFVSHQRCSDFVSVRS
jgi:hypothetical protein